MPIETAVILAAGAGTKFWPYNVVRNKVAFPIANVPAVRRVADGLIALGVTRLVVVVGTGEASVRHALRGAAGDIRYVRQPHAAGTADAVLHAAGHVDGDFLVVYGDVVTDPANLVAVRDAFEATRPLAATLVQPFKEEDPRSWIVAHVDGDALRGVEGHARGGSHRLGGVFALRLDALPFLQDNPGIMKQVPVGGMPPVDNELAQSLQMMLDEHHDVAAVEAVGYYVDLDKPWHILEANWRVISHMTAALTESVIPASARIHDGAELAGPVVLGENVEIGNRVVARGPLWVGDGASITNGAILEGPAVIGRETRVRDYCQIGGHTSLGALGVYGHGAEFSGVALDTVYCYHYCEIWGVVGEATDFGAATVCGNLRFDDGDTVWRVKGRAETVPHAANAAYFGDFMRTGVNAVIMPGRRMGAYSVVGPGVLLYDDLPDRQIVMAKQELHTGDWGPERYGW
jgi:NDP-sugar pyrophosphorylase family protein